MYRCRPTITLDDPDDGLPPPPPASDRAGGEPAAPDVDLLPPAEPEGRPPDIGPPLPPPDLPPTAEPHAKPQPPAFAMAMVPAPVPASEEADAAAGNYGELVQELALQFFMFTVQSISRAEHVGVSPPMFLLMSV